MLHVLIIDAEAWPAVGIARDIAFCAPSRVMRPRTGNAGGAHDGSREGRVEPGRTGIASTGAACDGRSLSPLGVVQVPCRVLASGTGHAACGARGGGCEAGGAVHAAVAGGGPAFAGGLTRGAAAAAVEVAHESRGRKGARVAEEDNERCWAALTHARNTETTRPQHTRGEARSLVSLASTGAWRGPRTGS